MSRLNTREDSIILQLEKPIAQRWEELSDGTIFTLQGRWYQRVLGGCKHLSGPAPKVPIMLKPGTIVLW